MIYIVLVRRLGTHTRITALGEKKYAQGMTVCSTDLEPVPPVLSVTLTVTV